MTSVTMDLQEAADTLKVHPHTMEKIIRAGGIPAGTGRAAQKQAMRSARTPE